MGGIMKTVLVLVVVAAVVAAGPRYINSAVLKDGISIRKCDFPFLPSLSTGGFPNDLCNGRVFCVDDDESPNNPWYLLQSRSSRSRDFNKNYSAYVNGFGESLVDDFWLGLMCLHRMTNSSNNNELLVRMVDRAGDVGTAVYSSFSVGPPSSKYQLRVEEYDEERSDAGDSMGQSNGMKFTALDQDNDEDRSANCARKCLGGWWYQNCNFNSVNNFLNGYFTRGFGHRDRGVQWQTWETQSPVVSTLILFRPRVQRVPCESTKVPIYTCPNRAAKFENSSCFLVADNFFTGTYDSAAIFCNSLAMRVASIRSQEEQAFVARLLNGSVWIDLKDEEKEGFFVWGDGSPLEYHSHSFGAGEPNDRSHRENCVAMSAEIGYKWIDQSCSDRNQFLCKRATIAN